MSARHVVMSPYGVFEQGSALGTLVGRQVEGVHTNRSRDGITGLLLKFTDGSQLAVRFDRPAEVTEIDMSLTAGYPPVVTVRMEPA